VPPPSGGGKPAAFDFNGKTAAEIRKALRTKARSNPRSPRLAGVTSAQERHTSYTLTRSSPVANITTTAVDDGLATIIAAEALGYLKANTVLARLVARDWDDNVASYGQVVKIPFTGSLSVNDKAADTVITLNAPTDTSISVTLNKHKEVSAS
jgi:hypothetical protein